jgi:hypothetical protein
MRPLSAVSENVIEASELGVARHRDHHFMPTSFAHLPVGSSDSQATRPQADSIHKSDARSDHQPAMNDDMTI